MEDYVDITPKNNDPLQGRVEGRGMVFQETEWRQINLNPEGLTKEGLAERIRIWKDSINRHVYTKYLTMQAQCEKIRPSGKTNDGRIIFSRDADGSAKWVSTPSGKLRGGKEEVIPVSSVKGGKLKDSNKKD